MQTKNKTVTKPAQATQVAQAAPTVVQKPLEFTVDTDIPMPARRGGREIYGEAFRNMEVGHSFFLPGADPKRASAIVSHWKEKLNRKYAVRAYKEGEVEGARIWRIEDEEIVAPVDAGKK